MGKEQRLEAVHVGGHGGVADGERGSRGEERFGQEQDWVSDVVSLFVGYEGSMYLVLGHEYKVCGVPNTGKGLLGGCLLAGGMSLI